MLSTDVIIEYTFHSLILFVSCLQSKRRVMRNIMLVKLLQYNSIIHSISKEMTNSSTRYEIITRFIVDLFVFLPNNLLR